APRVLGTPSRIVRTTPAVNTNAHACRVKRHQRDAVSARVRGEEPDRGAFSSSRETQPRLGAAEAQGAARAEPRTPSSRHPAFGQSPVRDPFACHPSSLVADAALDCAPPSRIDKTVYKVSA